MHDEVTAHVDYYGSRKTGKLARCYYKPNIDAFRVEVELHGGLLRRHDISSLNDFAKLPDVLCPKHIKFVDLDWKRLERYLAKNHKSGGKRIIVGARDRAASLQRMRRYLSRKGVLNVHRFFVELPVNSRVKHALRQWARNFER